MRKGLIIKIILILLALTMSVSPFLYSNNVYADETIVDWDTFGVDIAQTGAYSYWYRYGLSNISYQEQQSTGYVITTTFGQHNYNLSYQGILTGTYTDMNVYNYNGAKLGKYHSAYHTSNTAGNLDYIVYIDSSNNQQRCSKCYVGFETADDYITRITEAEYQSQEAGNDTYVNRFQQVIPSLNGTYSHPTTYNSRFKGFAYPGKKYVISFANDISLNYITYNIELISDRDISALSVRQANQTNMLNWSLKTFEITNSGNTILPFDWYCPQLNNKNVVILPIYQGEIEQMTPELYQLAYSDKYIYETHDAELISIMSSGNNASQQTEQDADNINNELSSSDSEYSTLENQFSSDLNTNLNNIDNSLNLNNNNSFIASANYVKDRFNWMTNNLPAINLVITFSLLVGLTTLLIGKVFK